MEVLEQLAMALGLASLAGINLYLTVFVTGLAIQQQWITLAPQYEALAVLGHPLIVVLAGIFYFCEFFADKIPWVDSAWDAVHTAIRPIGAALLSIQVLGDPNPVMTVIAALIGGSAALTTHTAKSAVRLLVNTSPEPVSNSVVSVTEDTGVVAGLALLYFHPAIGIGLCLLLLAVTLYLFPKLWRSTRITLHLLFRKIRMGSVEKSFALEKLQLPARLESHFLRMNPALASIRWAAPVISRRGPRMPRNIQGYLVATDDQPEHLFFLAKSRFSQVMETIPLPGIKTRHETRFLIEELHLLPPSGKPHYLFGLDRSRRLLARELASAITMLATQTPSPTPSSTSIPSPEATTPEPPPTAPTASPSENLALLTTAPHAPSTSESSREA